nr:MAG TPA: hypothetical protein [Caudoviricetes sp.]
MLRSFTSALLRSSRPRVRAASISSATSTPRVLAALTSAAFFFVMFVSLLPVLQDGVRHAAGLGEVTHGHIADDLWGAFGWRAVQLLRDFAPETRSVGVIGGSAGIIGWRQYRARRQVGKKLVRRRPFVQLDSKTDKGVLHPYRVVRYPATFARRHFQPNHCRVRQLPFIGGKGEAQHRQLLQAIEDGVVDLAGQFLHHIIIPCVSWLRGRRYQQAGARSWSFLP